MPHGPGQHGKIRSNGLPPAADSSCAPAHTMSPMHASLSDGILGSSELADSGPGPTIQASAVPLDPSEQLISLDDVPTL